MTSRCGPTPPAELPIEDKVSFLQREEAYPERPSGVEVKETHMSWVFLTDMHAYKLKKPVRSDAFDFRTLRARRYYCQEEVRLNQRLAPGIYLGIVPLGMRPDGSLQLGQDGTVVEWLIKMKRLPAERTLENMIRAGKQRRPAVLRIARVLSRFYRQSAPLAIDPFRHRKTFFDELGSNEATLLDPAYGLAAPMITEAARAGRIYLEQQGWRLEQRARDRRIVEAHGDLRPEHIYLLTEPVMIDRLEFSAALRTLDPVDELSYLALECDRLGAPRVGPLLFEVYEAESGEILEPGLIAFYKVFRAMVRAKLAALHIDDPTVRDLEKWRRRASDYLHIAHVNAQTLS